MFLLDLKDIFLHLYISMGFGAAPIPDQLRKITIPHLIMRQRVVDVTFKCFTILLPKMDLLRLDLRVLVPRDSLGGCLLILKWPRFAFGHRHTSFRAGSHSSNRTLNGTLARDIQAYEF